MSESYVSAFNGGVMSDYMDSRIDIDKYRSGCKVLTNMFVHAVGGVTRRSGTEYIADSGDDVRLIPFNFSENDAYICEFTPNHIKIYDDNGYTGLDIPSLYDASDLASIQYERVFDLLFLTCPNKETQVLKRTHLSPLAFVISDIEYDYPPFMQENDDKAITIASSVTLNNTTGNLVASENLFDEGHVGSQWLVRHSRGSTNNAVVGNETGTNPTTGLDVPFSNWTVTTDNIWKGYVVLQKSYDDGVSYEDVTVIADTRNSKEGNFVIDSTGKEGANTRIRLFIEVTSGTLSYNIKSESIYWDGIVTILAVADAKNATARVDSKLMSVDATHTWAEGSFSEYRGYPRTVEYFEERLVFSGTKSDLNKVYMSGLGNYYSFLTGPNDDEAVIFQPSSPEQTAWTISKDKLFIGTEGSVLKAYSIDPNVAIANSNIKSDEEVSYGCEPIPAILANEVVVFAQRQGHKLRELVFNDSQQGYVSQDLTILASNVIESGITAMEFSKTPDQIIWCLRGDGKIAGMTYERGEGIAGWHEHDFGGEVLSIAVKRSDGEDELWMVVKRDTGTFLERSAPRMIDDNLLDAWYVDSGVKTVLQPESEFESMSGDVSDHVVVTSTDHGLAGGTIIRFSNVNSEDDFNDNEYIITDPTTDEFTLKDVYGNYLNSLDFNGVVLESLTGDYTPVSNTWTGLDHLEGKTVQIQGDGGYAGIETVVGGSITTDDYYNQAVIGLQYISIVQPMYIEPAIALTGKLKKVNKVSIKFKRTVGALLGTVAIEDREVEIDLDDFIDTQKVYQYPYNVEVVNFRRTSDNASEAIQPFTGEKLAYVENNYERLKGLFCIQNLPLPLTVLSMAVFIDTGM